MFLEVEGRLWLSVEDVEDAFAGLAQFLSFLWLTGWAGPLVLTAGRITLNSRIVFDLSFLPQNVSFGCEFTSELLNSTMTPSLLN